MLVGLDSPSGLTLLDTAGLTLERDELGVVSVKAPAAALELTGVNDAVVDRGGFANPNGCSPKELSGMCFSCATAGGDGATNRPTLFGV